jgi:hypothetical protein
MFTTPDEFDPTTFDQEPLFTTPDEFVPMFSTPDEFVPTEAEATSTEGRATEYRQPTL